jgi:hypothetical protein
MISILNLYFPKKPDLTETPDRILTCHHEAVNNELILKGIRWGKGETFKRRGLGALLEAQAIKQR